MITLISTLIPIIMALIESLIKKRAVMASKYRYRIDAEEALKDKLVEFI